MDTGERFNFVLRLHAKLAHGGALYIHYCEDFGITQHDERRNSRAPWVRTYLVDDPALEGHEWSTLRDCVAALRQVNGITSDGWHVAEI